MSGLERGRELEEFEARLREWGGRPPSLPPAIAANRVVGRLPERRSAVPWLWLAAAAAMLVLIAVAAWVGSPGRAAAPVAATASGVQSGDVVQFWLDAETPVYFVLPEFGQGKGESS